MSFPSGKKRAPLNRTISITEKEIKHYSQHLLRINNTVRFSDIENKIINNNIFDILDFLPSSFVDLLFIDPPYNLPKRFNTEIKIGPRGFIGQVLKIATKCRLS